MIAYLRGTPLILGTELTMVVHGVGYAVAVGGKALAQLATKTEAELWIHTHVREDVLDLYGFLQQEDRRLFHILLSVSGVGPRTALGIIEAGASPIIEAVQTANVSFFSSVPRVGKKLAQKIIIELKPKLGSLQELNLGPRNQQEADVSDALSALGFSERDIQLALQGIDFSLDQPSAALIKEAIKKIGHQ